MDFVIEGKKISFCKEELDYSYLGEGKEAVVYSYGKYALKIYHDFSNKTRLSEEDTLKLVKLDTKRLLLPRKIIYDVDGNMMGYLTLKHESYSLVNLTTMKMNKFIEEIKNIETDAFYLGKNNVKIEDLILNNVVYDGNINLVDPGSYSVNINNNFYEITNNSVVQEFVIFELLGYIARNTISNKAAKILASKFDLASDYPISYYLSETANNNCSVKKYVKELLK